MLSAIKLHLDSGELAAIERYAAALQVTPEDVLYAALNRMMNTARDPGVKRDILETRAWRGENLPLWSDSAGSVHAYEGKADDEPEPSPYL